jgi:streptogramin lyase
VSQPKKEPAEILEEHGPFPGIDNVRGVTFDGENAWIAGGDRLQAIGPGGKAGKTLAVRADAGTAYDGKHFFQIAEGEIRKIDPASGAILGVVPAPPNTSYAGLTWAEGALWVAVYGERKILKLDPRTGAVLRTLRSDRLVTGVTFAEGELWHATLEDGVSDLRRLDPESGAVIESLAMPAGSVVSGLEYAGGDRFYAGGARSGRLRVVRRPKR